MANGKVGPPKGNTNSATGKDGRRALELALEHYPDMPEVIGRIKTLIKMWHPIIGKAFVDGDLAAIKEINDRLDGKASQSIDLNADITAREEKLTPEDIRKIAKELDGDC